MEDQGLHALSVEGGEASQPTMSMSELLDQEFSRIIPTRGEVIEGTIVGKSQSDLIIDIGCKSEGVVTERDLERLDPEFVASLRVGDQVVVYVLRAEGRNGNAILSLSRAQMESDWRKAQEVFDSGEAFDGSVVGANRGGLIVNVGRVRGFVPASQVCSVRLAHGLNDEQREELLGSLMGKTVHFKVIELDRRRNRLILSERVAVREWRSERKRCACWTTLPRARFGEVWSAAFATLAPLWTWAGQTAWCTCPSCRGAAWGTPAGADGGARGRRVCSWR